MKKLAFIYNPKAGKKNMDTYLVDVLRAFGKNGYEVTLVETMKKGHLTEYIREEGARFDTVVVSGGDGTVNESFNALMEIEEERRPSLGYIPMGTTNDFASSNNISKDPYRAAQIASGDGERKIDAGKFNDRYFSYVAAFGAFTSVAYATPTEYKNIFGYAAYVAEGIKALGTIKPYKMKIEADGEIIEDEFIFGMVANSTSVGKVRLDRMDVDLSDGLFEVLLIKKVKAGELNIIIGDLMNNKRKSDHYYIFKASKIEFLSEEDIAWTLDGEFGGETGKALVQNIPGAIKIKIEED